MTIVVNGARLDVEDGLTVTDLIARLGHRGRVAVERNGTVLRQGEHAEVRIADGDVLEIVTFVGGG